LSREKLSLKIIFLIIIDGDYGSCVKDGRLVTQFEKQFEAMTFRTFLTHLLRYRRKGNKIVGLLDNPLCYKISNRLGYILFTRI